MRGSSHTVADVMTPTVVAVSRHARFKDIVEAMDHWRVSAVPVLDEDRRVAGVVSEADLLPKEEFRNEDPSRLDQQRRLDDLRKAGSVTAEELMSAPAVCVRPDATLAQAARVMARRSLKRLPVVDIEGRLKGIVSRPDLLKIFLRSDSDLARELHQEVVERFPADTVRALRVTVDSGVVTFSGELPDSALVPVMARLARAVEGVVDVEFELSPGPRKHGPDPPGPEAR